jgi:hypothetical protein
VAWVAREMNKTAVKELLHIQDPEMRDGRRSKEQTIQRLRAPHRGGPRLGLILSGAIAPANRPE